MTLQNSTTQKPPPTSDIPYEVDADVYDDEDARYATESYQTGRHVPLNLNSSSSLPSSATAAQSLQSHYQPPNGGGIGGFQAPITIQPPSNTSHNHSFYPGAQPDHASYLTSSGMELEQVVRLAYLFPPFTSVGILIYETSNDLARFHAYQASLYGVIAFVAFFILQSLFGGTSFTLFWMALYLFATWYAGQIACRGIPSLAKEPYLPYIAPLAEEWVGGE